MISHLVMPAKAGIQLDERVDFHLWGNDDIKKLT
jgi:hypothetical protein